MRSDAAQVEVSDDEWTEVDAFEPGKAFEAEAEQVLQPASWPTLAVEGDWEGCG